MTNVKSYNALHQIIDGMRSDFESEAYEPYMAMDVASDVLSTNRQLRDAITEHYPDVTDQVMFLAEQIAG